jgi:peptidoglycan/xylan/chitin deacetylase (PgdA/CDA1 family)
VEEHGEIFRSVIAEKHAVGNHTFYHVNAWKTKEEKYLNDIYEAKKIIPGNLFRPPYGRINNFLVAQLKKEKYNLRTIMWSVLSGDFDKGLSDENCYLNVIRNTKPGSIIVFHDSDKAFAKLQFTLPKVLEYFNERGYIFKSIA